MIEQIELSDTVKQVQRLGSTKVRVERVPPIVGRRENAQDFKGKLQVLEFDFADMDEAQIWETDLRLACSRKGCVTQALTGDEAVAQQNSVYLLSNSSERAGRMSAAAKHIVSLVGRKTPF